MDKTFSIVLDDGAHFLLKTRAKALALKIGQHLENMIAALELRIARELEKAKIARSGHSETEALKILLKADGDGWDQQQIDDAFMNLRSGLSSENLASVTWTPKVQL